MLIALLAALAATIAVVPSAMALDLKVRVETRGGDYPYTSFFDRRLVSVDPAAGPVADQTAPSNTCGPDSAIAALQKAVGPNAITFENTDAPTRAAARITKLLGIGTAAPAATPPTWEVYAGGVYVSNPCASLSGDYANTEVLAYLKCGAGDTRLSNGCFNGTPLMLRLLKESFWPLTAVNSQVSVPVFVFRASQGGVAPATSAFLSVDRDSKQTLTDQKFLDGSARIDLPDNRGPHTILAQNTNGGVLDVPDRIPVCATDGRDGFCGTTKSDIIPFNVEDFPAPCITNGHDGFCGTTDTSGPVTHVLNIKEKQVFKKKKGPGQIKGTLDEDPNGVGKVRFRLSRQVQGRVAIKAKKKTKKKSRAKKSDVASAAAKKKAKKKPKKRYRKITRCSVWNGDTLNIESAKCTKTTTAKWFDMDLNDLRNEFTYGFALTLPAGKYVLEVESTDENGSKDAPAPGRNVLKFTVL
jgi:hypothetical protein